MVFTNTSHPMSKRVNYFDLGDNVEMVECPECCGYGFKQEDKSLHSSLTECTMCNSHGYVFVDLENPEVYATSLIC